MTLVPRSRRVYRFRGSRGSRLPPLSRFRHCHAADSVHRAERSMKPARAERKGGREGPAFYRCSSLTHARVERCECRGVIFQARLLPFRERNGVFRLHRGSQGFACRASHRRVLKMSVSSRASRSRSSPGHRGGEEREAEGRPETSVRCTRESTRA